MDFKDELLVRWHTQFAENQRIREQSFLKILGFLGTIIVGYSFIYQNHPEEIFLVAVAANTLIFFGAWQVITIAYNFRRDQFINVQIRKRAHVIGKGNIFPQEFDPYYSLVDTDSKRYYSWIPDFLLSYYLIFPFFQIFLMISFCYRTISTIDKNCINIGITLMILISIIFITGIILPFYYQAKLVEKFKLFNQDNPYTNRDIESRKNI